MHIWRRHFLKMSGLAAGTLVAPQGHAAESASGSARMLRLTLDDGWRIARDESNSGVQQEWFRAQHAEAVPIRVPSILQEAFPGYHGAVWYWISFSAPAKSSTFPHALLMFHAVDYYAEVWLNGSQLGSHEGGETPFTLDATNALRIGENNFLAVRVLNPPTAGIDGFLLKQTPHGNKAQPYATGNRYDYGGIVEPVELLLTPALRIADVQIRPDWRTGAVRIRASIDNRLLHAVNAKLLLTVAGGPLLQPQEVHSFPLTLLAGGSVHEEELQVDHPQLWDIGNPCCYELTACLSGSEASSDTVTTRFGFRDFRLIDGYFHLNGRRIFVKCTHTGNHVPFSQVTAPPSAPDMLRMDLVYAKASGFNMVRFISGVAHPWQLDLCDSLGLMVYEESLASWLLEDSPEMRSRYESSVREMVLRDRNHPSLVMWGMLNETVDGPVFREAVASLPLVRALDPDRLILLSSGRFDGHLEVGSAANPGKSSWQFVWGKESAGASQTKMQYPSGVGTGDFHFYPEVPQSAETKRVLRTLGAGSKPVFLSEYGIGSMMHVLYESRRFEQAGVRPDAEDNMLMHSMASRLIEDWNRFGMESAYPFPEMLLEESERAMALHRQEGFDLIRSNPQIAGFSLTGMLNHGMTGEGIWRFWREWKPAAFDAMRDGWSPVRWCLFAEPAHLYTGETVRLEAVLANEDAIPPGDYDASFRVVGPAGAIWKRDRSFSIPAHSPFAIPVISEEVAMNGPAGEYAFIPSIPRGIATPWRSQKVVVADRKQLPRLDGIALTSWGLSAEAVRFLEERGATVVDFHQGARPSRECILVGTPVTTTAERWTDLARRVAQGGFAIFLQPASLAGGDNSARWVPAAKKGRIYELHDWLYHKECVAKPSAYFEGVQAPGMLRWAIFGPTLPRLLFDGFAFQSTEVHAAAFAAGYTAPGGYASGVLLADLALGAGNCVLQSFRLVENIGFPAADRMLVNMVLSGHNKVQTQKSPLPADFDSLLSQIGYTS